MQIKKNTNTNILIQIQSLMDLIPSMLLDRQFRLATPRSPHLQLALEGKIWSCCWCCWWWRCCWWWWWWWWWWCCWWWCWWFWQLWTGKYDNSSDPMISEVMKSWKGIQGDFFFAIFLHHCQSSVKCYHEIRDNSLCYCVIMWNVILVFEITVNVIATFDICNHGEGSAKYMSWWPLTVIQSIINQAELK